MKNYQKKIKCITVIYSDDNSIHIFLIIKLQQLNIPYFMYFS